MEILDAYRAEYPDVVRVFSHPNMGVARTRNEGISLSRGKYILFMDQDDYLDADYIRTFYDAIESGGYDVVIGGYKRPNDAGRITVRKLLSGKGYYQYITTFAWGKIHRAAFLKENRIEFFDNNIGEDVVFCIQEASLTNRFQFIKYVGYNWFMNKDSVSNKKHKGLRDDVNIIPWMEKMALFPFKTEKLKEYFLVKIPIYYLLHSGRESNAEKFLRTYLELFGWLRARFPGFEKNSYLLFGLTGETRGVKIPIAIFMRIHRLRLMKCFAALYCKG